MDADKKEAIRKVLERTRTARTELELEDVSHKAENMAQGLSESWQSPRAREYEETIFEIVNTMHRAWFNLDTTLEEAYLTARANADDED